MAHGISYDTTGQFFIATRAGYAKTWHKLETEFSDFDDMIDFTIKRVNFTQHEMHGAIKSNFIQTIANVKNADGTLSQYETCASGEGYTIENAQIAINRIKTLEELQVGQLSSVFFLGQDFATTVYSVKIGDFYVGNPSNNDVISTNLTIVQRNNYKGRNEVFTTGIRAICGNTLQMALNSITTGAAYSHTRKINEKAENAYNDIFGRDKEMAKYLENAQLRMAESNALFNKLAETRSSMAEMDMLAKALFTPKTDQKRAITRAENQRNTLIDCLYKMPAPVKDDSSITLYDAMNAFTYMASRHTETRGCETDAQKMATQYGNDFFGAGADLREKGYAELFKLPSYVNAN